MPNTPLYSIPLPIDFGSYQTWGQLLVNDTFRKFDQYLQQNPMDALIINASGTSASGSFRFYNNSGSNTAWEIRHTPSGTLDFWNTVSKTFLTITSGGDLYRYGTNNVSYGPAGFIHILPEPDAVGDWISASTTSFTDVDFSDDGVPKGAKAIYIKYMIQANGPDVYLFARKNGDSTASGMNICIMSSDGINLGPARTGCTIVPCDANSIVEFAYSNSFTGTKNLVWALGYVL